MTRRHPTDLPKPDDPIPVAPLRTGYLPEPGKRDQRPEDQGDRVQAWQVSGGITFFLDLPFITGNEILAGVQLLTSCYIPEGMTGFVKGIKVAPFKPSFLHSAASVEFVRPIGADLTAFSGPDGDQGYWQTPFAWEAYGTAIEEAPPPLWRWHIRFLPGTLEEQRDGSNIPPFSFADPLSWALIPSVPVPREGYPQGIPGRSPGAQWGPQRFQRVGNWEQGAIHIVVPGDTTVALFAEWVQAPTRIRWLNTTTQITSERGQQIVLLPSFGQLTGYWQPANRTVTQVAAREGWQS